MGRIHKGCQMARGLDHEGLDHESAKMTKVLDHEGAKMTKNTKREGHEGGAPRRASSRPSRFVPFATLRGFVIQTLS